jgi:Fibronectin type III domain
MSAARRFTLTSLCALFALAGGLLCAGPALAVAPEAPSRVEVESVKATTVFVHGVLNPEATVFPIEEGTYEFLYKASSTVSKAECESPGASKAPEAPGMYFGLAPESVYQELIGLSPGTEYTVCLLARNGKGETTVGPAVGFKTALPPETPETLKAEPVTSTTAKLRGVLNPTSKGELGSYKFVYRQSGTECEGGSQTPGEPALGDTPEPVSAEVTGLVPNTQYTFCVLAYNAAEEAAMGPPVTFTTLAVAPTVEGESFSEVGSASVDLNAEVNDYGVLGSTYCFEYGTSTSYGSTTPIVSLSVVNGGVGAPTTLSGLHPDTVYHFRVVASSEAGVTRGADMEFSTLAQGLPGLPDGRVYEMVTPPDNHDASAEVPESDGSLDFGLPGISGTTADGPFQAAASGDAVTYVGEPTTGGNGVEGGFRGNQYLATHSPRGGWTQINVQPNGYRSPMYRGFSSDLSIGIIESKESLLAGIPNPPFYRYYTYATHPGSESYQPTGEVEEDGEAGFAGGNAGTSAVPAFSHVLTQGPEGLLDATGGRLVAVNVLPDGERAPSAVYGAPRVFLSSSNGGSALEHVISADGSRIFWMDRATGALYVRENDAQPQSPTGPGGECTVAGDACTVQIDAGSSGGALYWTASGDGSKVFFTDCGRLTADSTAMPTPRCGAEEGGRLAGSDLYEYDVESGTTTDLTVDHNASDPLGANVQGVVGAGEDGEYVYFVATGSLAAGASAGEPNLYVEHGGVVTFIVTLSFADNQYGSGGGEGGGVGVWEQSLAERTAQVAPDGRNLVFGVGKNYAPVPEGTEETSEGEVYRYEVEGGRLVCVSCSPSVEVSSLTSTPVDGAQGGFLPVPGEFSGPDESVGHTYQTRWLSDDGSRVFFESSKALVPQDVNGLQDVYEWERDGSGSCRESPGCVYLLSGGTSTAYSTLLDASPSGDDVFIITRAQLTPEDGNQNFNVFDVRVGGVRPLAPPACSASGCQGAPAAPPLFATPASATFSGVGNFPAPGTSAAKTKVKAKTKARHGSKRKRGRRSRARGGRRRGLAVRGRVRRGADLGRSER